MKIVVFAYKKTISMIAAIVFLVSLNMGGCKVSQNSVQAKSLMPVLETVQLSDNNQDTSKKVIVADPLLKQTVSKINQNNNKLDQALQNTGKSVDGINDIKRILSNSEDAKVSMGKLIDLAIKSQQREREADERAKEADIRRVNESIASQRELKAVKDKLESVRRNSQTIIDNQSNLFNFNKIDPVKLLLYSAACVAILWGLTYGIAYVYYAYKVTGFRQSTNIN